VRPELGATLAPALTGWQAHRHPFAFAPEMEYAEGAWRWLAGTPVIPALYAATAGPRILREAGIEAIRAKSTRQTSRLIELADASGFTVRAPRDAARRGGTVAFDVPHAREVARALLARDTIVDYRPGAGIRVAPHFYTRDDEVESVVGMIDEILAREEWTRFVHDEGVVT
jgi:kynureninase